MAEAAIPTLSATSPMRMLIVRLPSRP